MADSALVDQPAPKKPALWIPMFFLKPRRVFEEVHAAAKNSWVAPILTLTVTTLLYSLVKGWIQAKLTMMGEIPLPPDWQWWSPDMQNQYMQAFQATQSPVFIYVIPALMSILGVWIGWLFVGGFLHLVLTLLGGRGSVSTMNVVAWASLVFALRDVIRIFFMLAVQRTISSPGLSGFVPITGGNGMVFLSRLMEQADLFLIWWIVLMVIGIRSADSLSRPKAVASVVAVVAITLMALAGLGTLVSNFSGLAITRQFF